MTNPQSNEEILRLAALYELNVLDTPSEERFDRITRLAATLMDVPIAYISFIDQDRQWIKSMHGDFPVETPRTSSMCNVTIQQDGLLVIPDASIDPNFANSPIVVNDPHVRFYAGYPLSTTDGYKIGSLCAIDKIPKKITPEQMKSLEDLAALAKDQLTLVDVINLQKQIRGINITLEEAKGDLEKRNQFIRKAFSCYMSDEVVANLLQSVEPLKLGGEERWITVLFSDLRDFTGLSEQLSADRLVTALNNYYGKMVEVISKYQGTIDAFIGDAILALFGAPLSTQDDSLRAVACAIEMQLMMKEVNEENRRNGLPELSMGIGINTGPAVVGNIGSIKRMKYSAIGSPVNLAARIQGFSLGGQILISETTLKEINPFVKINGQLRVKLKGIKSPVTIYDIIGISGQYNRFIS